MTPRCGNMWLKDKEMLSWAAGIVEGEGSFFLNYTNDRRDAPLVYRYMRPRLQVAQSSSDGMPDMLARLKFIFGGYVHGAKELSGNRKPTYCWTLHGFERVQAAAAALWPWMGRVKRDQYRKIAEKYFGRGGTRICTTDSM